MMGPRQIIKKVVKYVQGSEESAAALFFGASGAGGGVSNMPKGTQAAQGFRTWWVVVHGNSRQILAPGIAQAYSVCR